MRSAFWSGLERVFFGCLLLIPGLLKFAALAKFRAALSHYGLVPYSTLPLVSVLLALLEVIVGGLILLGLALPYCWWAAETLFYIFSLAVASVLWRGLKIPCGCFGIFSVTISTSHFVLCLGVATYLTWRRHSRSDRQRRVSEDNRSSRKS